MSIVAAALTREELKGYVVYGDWLAQELAAQCLAQMDEIEALRKQVAEMDEALNDAGRLRDSVEYVINKFERDEAQGYRSRDRQFAITILRARAAGKEDRSDG